MESRWNPLKSMRRLYKHYIRNCRRGNIFWDIPVELFHALTSSPCYYCDKPPSQHTRGYLYSGLDRMNPKQGYFKENVLPCCGECNRLKSNILTVEEMRVVGQALAAHRRSKKAPQQS